MNRTTAVLPMLIGLCFPFLWRSQVCTAQVNTRQPDVRQVYIRQVDIAQAGKVQVTAAANTSVVTAGRPFWIGYTFTIAPGFHIYWTNPGDSGLATQVTLNLPEGFKSGEVQFPVPEKLDLPGGSVCYGYENEVTLLVEVIPPKDLPASGTVKIEAKTSWLVCKEDCTPGSAVVPLEINAGASPVAANQDLFKEWTSHLPVTVDQDIAGSSKSASISDGNGTATIKLQWKKPVTDIAFIPGLLKTGDISDVKITNADGATGITFSIKNKTDQTPITGLVTFTKQDGSKTALDISIPAVPRPEMEQSPAKSAAGTWPK